MGPVASIAAAVMGGKVMKQFNVPALLGIVTGSTPPTPAQARVAQIFLEFTDMPNVGDAVTDLAFDALRGKGFAERDVFALLGSVAPLLEEDAPKTPKQALAFARSIAKRVLRNHQKTGIVHIGTVKCPDCGFVHLA